MNKALTPRALAQLSLVSDEPVGMVVTSVVELVAEISAGVTRYVGDVTDRDRWTRG